MALTFHTFKFLEKLKKNNLYFGETLTIGRLNNLLEKEDYKRLNIPVNQDVYADKLLKEHFNLLSLNALDYSSFENADIIHDLNTPLENSKKQFDTIVDFGTSEHVFNVTECLKNISNLSTGSVLSNHKIIAVMVFGSLVLNYFLVFIMIKMDLMKQKYF